VSNSLHWNVTFKLEFIHLNSTKTICDGAYKKNLNRVAMLFEKIENHHGVENIATGLLNLSSFGPQDFLCN